MRISANLGFLYRDLPLPKAILAAACDGFDAVECHFPYAENAVAVKAALEECGLPMVSLNTVSGSFQAGEFGLAALPDRMEEARAAIVQAIEYADKIGAKNVHVMAGKTGDKDLAEQVYRENLDFACKTAVGREVGILIEPINHRSVPGYHLSTVEHAAGIIKDLGHDNLRLMFDCYHVQIMQGDLIERIHSNLHILGHVQIAAVPDRGEPNRGEISFPGILEALRDMGYSGAIGAEYLPRDGSSRRDLGWLEALKAI